MKSLSLSDESTMNYESSIELSSKTTEGVTFRVKRITFGRRLELTRRIREIARRIEFADAGAGFTDKVEASLLSMEVDRLYLEWFGKRNGIDTGWSTGERRRHHRTRT